MNGDPTKVLQGTFAWAVRQHHSVESFFSYKKKVLGQERGMYTQMTSGPWGKS